MRRQLNVMGRIHDALAYIVLLNPTERGFSFALEIDSIEMVGGLSSGNLGFVRSSGCPQNKDDSERQNITNGKVNSPHREKYSLGLFGF